MAEPPRRRRRLRKDGQPDRRCRPPETLMTEQDVQVYDERSKTLTGKSHAKTTKTCYGSYWNALKQWLPLHIPACRDADGNLDEHLLREWVETHLEEARVKFLRFLSSRKHRWLTFEDGSPMPAKTDNLRGYCSAFTFHVWTKHQNTKSVKGKKSQRFSQKRWCGRRRNVTER